MGGKDDRNIQVSCMFAFINAMSRNVTLGVNHYQWCRISR